MSSASSHAAADHSSDDNSDLYALLDQGLQSTSSSTSPSLGSALPNASDKQPQEALEQAEQANKRRRVGTDQCPPHPGFIHGMCIRCGSFVTETTSTGVPLRYLHLGMQISAHEAERIRDQHLQHLFSVKKLLLVLDLDHTLLSSTRMADLPEETLFKAEQLLNKQGTEDEQLLFKLPHMWMWTKLRPGIRNFLVAAHKLFELHIYTHGDQDYAAEMAKLLDPKRILFGGRVISGRDSTQRHVKSLDVVLGADTAVLILDDTEGVWPGHNANLIQVDRYIFFPACATRFQRSHQCLLEEEKDENAEKGMLATALKVLQGVHERVFQAKIPSAQDVRIHLAEVRSQILAGTHLVFSHVIPLEQEMSQHHLWRHATQMGAVCHAKVCDDITHVVSTAQDTDKMHWAKKHNRHMVAPNWLFVSGFKWKKAKERDFPVKKKKADVYLLDPAADTAAAIAAAGGGSGTL